MIVEKTAIHFPGIEGGEWIQGKLSNSDFKGLVGLVDFWNYTCLNCIRALDYLKEWHERYAHLGLLVVGVHTPEFEFARDRRNVLSGIHAFDIPYSVVLDNSYNIWNAFANRGWPAKYLFDGEGRLRHQQFGEGGYAGFEEAIQTLLQERDDRAEFHGILEPLRESDRPGTIWPRSTPELYLGLQRGRIENALPTFDSGAEHVFTMPTQLSRETVNLAGTWSLHPQYAQYTGDMEGHILLHYSAMEVNLVMRSRKASKVFIMQDAQVLHQEDAGEDVRLEGEDATVTVREPRMYQLIRNVRHGSHFLSLSTSDQGLEVYVFSFAPSPTLGAGRQ